MARNTEFISIRTSLADFYEDNKIKQQDVNEDELLKWATDKGMDLMPSALLRPSVAWVDVNNYKGNKPKNLQIVLEMAYRLDCPKMTCGQRGYQITQWIQGTEEGCELEINLVCPACHKTGCGCNEDEIIVDIGTGWDVNHPEQYYDQYVKVGRFGYGTSVYDPNWKILCYSDNRYHGLNQHLPGCASTYCVECPHSYRLDTPTIETSFEEGEILVSYLGRILDETGEIMIPDHRDVREAMLQYLTYKYFRGLYLLKRDPSDKDIYLEAKQLMREATDSARAKLTMPSFKEFSRFWAKNKWSKIDSAYENLLDGKYLGGGRGHHGGHHHHGPKIGVPTNTNSRRNPYRS